MLLQPIKEQKDLKEERSARLLEVEDYFRKHLQNKDLSFPEEERIVSDLQLSFTIRREIPQHICLEVMLANNGEISGICYRKDLYKYDNKDLYRFYNFHVTNKKELMREFSVLNFLLKTF